MKLLVVLVVLAALCASFASAQESAQLIVGKSINSDTNYVGVGEPFTVTVNVFNVGDGDATDVVVTDEWSSEYFSHVEGDQVKKLDTLAAGESVELNTTYIPKSEGQMRGFRAKVEFTPNDESEVETTYSSQPNPMNILTPKQFQRMTLSFLEHWGLIIFAVLLCVGVPAISWINFQITYPNGLPKANGKKTD